jgi:hypothetical protein
MRSRVIVAAALVAGAGSAAAVSACGEGEQAGKPAATQTQATTPKPPEKPVTLIVNREKRIVTLSKVDFAYCRKKTDVCSAIRGRKFARLSPVGRRAVIEARRRKRAREAAEREAARREAIRQQQLQQQQQQQAPQPQAPPGGGTETGTSTG